MYMPFHSKIIPFERRGDNLKGRYSREGLIMLNLNLKKALCAVLAAACVFSFTACSKINDGKNNGNSVGESGSETVEFDDIVLNIDGNPIDYEEYRYFYLNTKNDMDGGDASYWENNEEGKRELTESALNTLSQLYAIKSLANQYDVSVSEEDLAYIDSSIESMKESYGEETFLSMLESINSSLEMYREINKLSYLEYGLYDKIKESGDLEVDEDEVKALLLGDDYVRAMHILYADEETAAGILEEAKNATDDEFYELAQEAEDPGMIGNTAGYYFTYNQMIKSFEEAAFALEDGETSDLVKSDYGYHIIRRLAKSADYVDENYATLAETVFQSKYYELIDKKAAELLEGIEFEPCFELITVTTAK